MIVRMRVDRGSSVEDGEDGICVRGIVGGGVFFLGGLYIVRFMMMVCTYEIYENGEKKNCDFSLT